jgi:hypothetical protein
MGNSSSNYSDDNCEGPYEASNDPPKDGNLFRRGSAQSTDDPNGFPPMIHYPYDLQKSGSGRYKAKKIKKWNVK